jgi:hypothetical protein
VSEADTLLARLASEGERRGQQERDRARVRIEGRKRLDGRLRRAIQWIGHA